jgi:ribosome-associated translation inhibitor RaiA
MEQALQIRFLGITASDAVESTVRVKAAKLERFCPQIMSCRVTIEQPHRHQHQGRPFTVRIETTLPDHVLTVDRVHDEEVSVALRDAFDDMKRQLEDVVRRTRGQQKLHSPTRA